MLKRVAAVVLVAAFIGYVSVQAGIQGSPVGKCKCPGQYLVDAGNCTAFYECDQDLTPLAFGCPHNLQFNPVNNVCDFKSVVGCGPDGTRPSVSVPDPCAKP